MNALTWLMIPIANDRFLEAQERRCAEQDGLRRAGGACRLAHHTTHGFDGIRRSWKIEFGVSDVRAE